MSGSENIPFASCIVVVVVVVVSCTENTNHEVKKKYNNLNNAYILVHIY